MKVTKKMLISQLSEILLAFGLTAAVVLCTMAASCRVVPEGINIIGGEYKSPQLLNVNVNSKNNVEISFSKEVSFIELSLQNQKKDEKINLLQTEATILESEILYEFLPESELSCTENYVLSGIIEDEKQNSLTFTTEVTGFNNNVPKLVLSEIRNQYTNPKVEFIEFKSLSSGNTAGMIVEIVYKDVVTEYTFPAIAVTENQYVLLHLRSKDETCIDEIPNENGNNFSKATYSPCSVEDVCDLWVKANEKIIGDYGIILIKERKNGKVIDGIAFGETAENFSTPSLTTKYAELAQSDIWIAPKETDDDDSIQFIDASLSTNSRTINRINFDFPIQATDWIIVKAKKATPGFENSIEVYVP